VFRVGRRVPHKDAGRQTRTMALNTRSPGSTTRRGTSYQTDTITSESRERKSGDGVHTVTRGWAGSPRVLRNQKGKNPAWIKAYAPKRTLGGGPTNSLNQGGYYVNKTHLTADHNKRRFEEHGGKGREDMGKLQPYWSPCAPGKRKN